MSELKKFGDPEYGPYGYGFCNPAFYDQEPVTNQEYLDTIPDDDPWKPVLVEGFAELDAKFPGWSVVQIKEKFFQCRFYANQPEGSTPEQFTLFEDILLDIERRCDEANERAKK